ncbi:hypothetical protein PIB30_010596 [Stylosanthes scabra]|uniref:Uncharacterized protein n=1 Tax=Stylosanthes scabra TaxID=79078 RepID=A0ABU6T5E8_9FABA|nr:hypothetical protein [Stylosanthes scabra]
MRSSVTYNKIESESSTTRWRNEEKYEDSDEKANSDLVVVKTRRCHFDGEPFIHLLHSDRFDPVRPYGLSTEFLSTLRHRDSANGKDPSYQRLELSRRSSSTLWYLPLGPITRLISPSSSPKVDSPTYG